MSPHWLLCYNRLPQQLSVLWYYGGLGYQEGQSKGITTFLNLFPGPWYRLIYVIPLSVSLYISVYNVYISQSIYLFRWLRLRESRRRLGPSRRPPSSSASPPRPSSSGTLTVLAGTDNGSWYLYFIRFRNFSYSLSHSPSLDSILHMESARSIWIQAVQPH